MTALPIARPRRKFERHAPATRISPPSERARDLNEGIGIDEIDRAEIHAQRPNLCGQRAYKLFRAQRSMVAQQSRDIDRGTTVVGFERHSADLHRFSIH